jgi:8-oxo-dGTP pyrophosphatase MutT (NUDIX family)
VFDILDEPDFTAVVPGGRVEPGETVAETAVRELDEETGLAIRVVSELGVAEQESWRVPPIRDENHFVHAIPAGETEDEWVHLGAVRCHWIPVVAGMSVYGEHGAFLDRLL